MKARTAQLFGGILALLGVVLGAFGAHLLKARLMANGMLDGWQTAVHYQWFHALALLALAGRVTRGPAVCWLVGVFFFSGSLYILTLYPAQRWAGPVTPLGGLLLTVGWGWFIFQTARRRD